MLVLLSKNQYYFLFGLLVIMLGYLMVKSFVKYKNLIPKHKSVTIIKGEIIDKRIYQSKENKEYHYLKFKLENEEEIELIVPKSEYILLSIGMKGNLRTKHNCYLSFK